MKRLLLSLVAAVAMVVSAGPVQAASETLHFSFKGLVADAFFSSTDPTGCVVTEVGVGAVDGRVKTMPGGPEAQSEAFMFLSQFNTCTREQLIAADGFTVLAPADFQIDRELNAARLDTTIELFDFISGTILTVDVSVAWTGAGATFTVKDRFHQKSPGFKINSRFSGTFREATATGMVTDGTTNFTPDPAVFAQLGSVKTGEVQIIHE
jgi:hypothetical protein